MDFTFEYVDIAPQLSRAALIECEDSGQLKAHRRRTRTTTRAASRMPVIPGYGYAPYHRLMTILMVYAPQCLEKRIQRQLHGHRTARWHASLEGWGIQNGW
jgi:hypothetical protein